MQQYLYYHLPWKILMIAIFVQSSIGTIKLPDLGFTWDDKVLHFFVFGILAILIARSFKKTNIIYFNKYYLLWAIVLTGIYGMSDEYHQYFVPGRSATVGDWVADILGAIFFVLIFFYLEKRNRLITEKVSQ